jgi:alginate O-acetyltransferase complex protein AlgI
MQSNPTTATTQAPGADHRRSVAAVGLGLLPIAAWWYTRGAPAWVVMWAIAGTEFFALKLLTLAGLWKTAPAWRIAAYLLLWPGMNAKAFLTLSLPATRTATGRELAVAMAKLALGLAMTAWTVAHVTTASHLLVGWVGMLGIIFTLHFGLFDLASWAWRRAGVTALPIMRAPVLATSLAEFWGERWNAAFADAARRFLFRPLARRLGATRAGGLVFLVSGLVHETVISLPAHGGWGGPTLYFLLQAAGISLEKSPAGGRLGLGTGWPGWWWMLLVTALPLPLLFHGPFIERAIVPFFQQIAKEVP